MTEVYFNGRRLGANMPLMQDRNLLYEPEFATPIVLSLPNESWVDGRQLIAIRQFQTATTGGLTEPVIGLGPETALLTYRGRCSK